MMYILSSLCSLISDTDPVLVLWVISSLCPEPSSASLHLLLRLTSQISAQHSHSVRESPKSHSRSGSSRYCLHDIIAALVTISMWLLISVMMCCVSPPGPRSHSTETVPVTASCLCPARCPT